MTTDNFTFDNIMKKWNPASSHPRFSTEDFVNIGMCTGKINGRFVHHRNLILNSGDVFNFIPDSFALNVSYDRNDVDGFVAFHGTYPSSYIILTANTIGSKTDKNLLRVDVQGTDRTVKAFMDDRQSYFTRKTPIVEWVTGIGSNGLTITEVSLQKAKPVHDSFYPCLNGESIESFIKRYMESDSTILLMIGSPGLGKTEFVRHIIWTMETQCTLTYDDQAAKSDALFSHFMESDSNVLLVEDADVMLQKRDDGNQEMKRILNVSDGLTSRKDKKFVFTTNLPNVRNVDPAMLRDGRCFEVLEFKRYTIEQATQVAIDIDLDPSIVATRKDWSLAELFAAKRGKVDFVEPQKSAGQSFGLCP